jgi:hypothetical protein
MFLNTLVSQHFPYVCFLFRSSMDAYEIVVICIPILFFITVGFLIGRSIHNRWKRQKTSENNKHVLVV